MKYIGDVTEVKLKIGQTDYKTIEAPKFLQGRNLDQNEKMKYESTMLFHDNRYV